MNAAPETHDKQIPPIIIQTLVENAIKHGIRQNTDGGYVRVESLMDGDYLIINIINSGQLLKKNLSEIHFKKNGIGLENSQKRLAMLYGDASSFTIKNKNDKEVIVTIKIPAAA
ncbi:MAG: ATP-binding protein [Bacteroidia bacterium]